MKPLIVIVLITALVFGGLYYYDNFVIEAYDLDQLEDYKNEGYVYAAFSAG